MDADARVGVLVGEDNWTFFREVHRALTTTYRTDVFNPMPVRFAPLQGRINRWAFDREMHRILRDNDVCFFEWAGELLARATRCPKRASIVTRLHSFELHHWGDQVNWSAVDRVVLVSRAMERMFQERYPDQAAKTVVIHNGCALERFRPLSDDRPFRFTLGMLGALTPIKRVYEIVPVVDALRRQGHPARLFLAGRPRDDLRYVAAIHNLVERLGLTEHVVFEGHVEDTPAWLQKIDILISNSYWEGQQMALLEGMAAGRQCLSHHWAGADEVLPADNLYVTGDELRAKIVDYAGRSAAEQRVTRQRLRALATERFDARRMVEQISDLIATLAGRRPRHR